MQYIESPWLPQFLEYQSHFIHWDAYIQSWKLDQPPLEQMLCNFYHSDFCPFTQEKTTIYTFSVLTTYNQILYQTQLKNKIWVKIAKQSPPHIRDRRILPVSNQMLNIIKWFGAACCTSYANPSSYELNMYHFHKTSLLIPLTKFC